ncbi:MAG: CAP domain-containing protein [Niabella sp.]
MKIFPVIPVVIAIILSCTNGSIPFIQNKSAADTAATASVNVNRNKLLQLVNTVRKTGCNCGATAMPPVAAIAWNELLATAAYNHSKDMNLENYFSHIGSDGSSPGDRILATGYKWKSYGENIAKGYATEKEVIEGWLKSEVHCKNIMNASFKEMGVSKAGAYWTQVFGSR